MATSLGLRSVLVLCICITFTLPFLMVRDENKIALRRLRHDQDNHIHSPQFKYDTIRSKQGTLYKLAKMISSHDYSTFNQDVLVDQHKFHHFSASKLIKVLSNKTIIFFGDSTMYRFYLFLIYCLDFYVQNISNQACQFDSTLLNRNYHYWNDDLQAELIQSGSLLKNTVTFVNNTAVKALSLQYNCTPINATLLLFENRWDYTDIPQLFALYKEWIQYKPDIIFWNPSVLHLLHLTPIKHFQNLKLTPRFMDDLMNIYLISERIGALLIYRGTSPLCYSNDVTPYRAVRSVYKHHFYGSNVSNRLLAFNYGQFLDRCIEQANKSKEVLDPKKLCETWTFMNEGGISYSNDVMRHFVDEIQNDKHGQYKNVFFYDRFNIFHKDEDICGAESADTAHWLPSYAADAMYFVNTLDFL